VENHTVTGYLTDARRDDEPAAVEAVRRSLRDGRSDRPA
jgi:hypothetical protein